MGKRKSSSLEKVSIAIAVALIIVGVLWMFVASASAAGTLFAEVKVDEKRDFVSVECVSTTIGNIKAHQVNIKMFSDQIATLEFKTGADVLDAVVVGDNGNVIETRQFTRGRGDIDFSAGGTRVIVLLDPGNDKVYKGSVERIDFLQNCRENFSIVSMENTVNDILRGTASQDFVAVIKVWVNIVQREITNVQGVWNYDEENQELELEITADSNLPKRTKIVYTTFGVDGAEKVKSDGKINFDIDFDKIDVKGDNKIVMEIGKWSDQFEIDPPPREAGIFIEPEPTPLPTPKSALKSVSKSTSELAETPTPIPTPTPKITRVLADPPTPTPKTPMRGLCVIVAIVAAAAIIMKK